MSASDRPERGIVLRPFRAARPTARSDRLGKLLCPPYDVIDAAERRALVAEDPDNAVTVVLPEPEDGVDRYRAAARRLDRWVRDGHYAVDNSPALFVYEMREPAGATTRGLVGALELRDPVDGVILPHENTMAGPVADRLALMGATDANVEPIYLVYDGGGPASRAVGSVDDTAPVASATTPDGITHTLWEVIEQATQDAVAADLITRRALIADGHHRYATYRELQRERVAQFGPGPWDYGLTLLVDSTSYGPQVHAIHRVLPGVALADAVRAVQAFGASVEEVSAPDAGLAELDRHGEFAVVLTDGQQAVVVSDTEGRIRAGSLRRDEPEALAGLDVSVLHRGFVERVLGLEDNVDTVSYAHSADDAVDAARSAGGIAVLLRPTPVAQVAAVAAAGARMPRKSTLFTPKPASGLLMRRFADA
ncbi:MAG TPA: DUF1015 domain-containing protein [Jatrophihabitantaceae bacterium]